MNQGRSPRDFAQRKAEKMAVKRASEADTLKALGLHLEATPRMIFGVNATREAVKVHQNALGVLLMSPSDSPRSRGLQRFAQDNQIEVREVERRILDSLSSGGLHQGVVCYAPPLQMTEFSELLERPQLLALALDGIVDPQNFGAVIRSAVGLSNAPVIWGQNSAAPLSPATFRASAGAVEHATLVPCMSLHGSLAEAAAAGVEIVGLALDDTAKELSLLSFERPTILVIGSEEKGMNRAVRKTCTQFGLIAQTGLVQSLNASVAAGISLHAALSQRAKLSQ